jgi:hypothetical protein
MACLLHQVFIVSTLDEIAATSLSTSNVFLLHQNRQKIASHCR